MNCFNLGFLAGPLRAAPATEFRFSVLKKLWGFHVADLGSGRVSNHLRPVAKLEGQT
jgi:hypothetical protein